MEFAIITLAAFIVVLMIGMLVIYNQMKKSYEIFVEMESRVELMKQEMKKGPAAINPVSAVISVPEAIAVAFPEDGNLDISFNTEPEEVTSSEPTLNERIDTTRVAFLQIAESMNNAIEAASNDFEAFVKAYNESNQPNEEKDRTFARYGEYMEWDSPVYAAIAILENYYPENPLIDSVEILLSELDDIPFEDTKDNE